VGFFYALNKVFIKKAARWRGNKTTKAAKIAALLHKNYNRLKIKAITNRASNIP
jgi:hypothetical protein